MCAWVENGIGGLLFWAYVIWFYVRQILRPVADEKHLGLYLAVAVLSLVWHILFSPMAGRIDQSVVIALVANDAYFLTHGAGQLQLRRLRRAA
jgi:O-antigen ligase